MIIGTSAFQEKNFQKKFALFVDTLELPQYTRKNPLLFVSSRRYGLRYPFGNPDRISNAFITRAHMYICVRVNSRLLLKK